MLTKKQILQAIEEMPEEMFTDFNAVINELILFEKIEQGLEDIKNGNVISDEELDAEINKW